MNLNNNNKQVTQIMSLLAQNSPMVSHCTQYKNQASALAGVAQWIECQPANQRVAISIPSQGTCLGSKPGPQ